MSTSWQREEGDSIEAKYYLAVVATGILAAIAYGYLNDPTGLSKNIFTQNETTNETMILAPALPRANAPLFPPNWWVWLLLGGGIVYMVKRGADYYVGASYEAVEERIRQFAQEHKNMPNIQVEELKEVARGVWEGHIRNNTDYRICQYPYKAPFKVRCVGRSIKEFTQKAVIDPREKQYITHDEMIEKQKSWKDSIPFIGGKPKPKQETVAVHDAQRERKVA